MATQAIKTPKGELEWVNISGEGKENLSGKMQYLCSIVLDPSEPEHKEFIDQVNKYWEDNKPKGFTKPAKSTGLYPHKARTDETDDSGKAVYEEDGLTVATFKTSVTWPDGKAVKVRTFNAKGKEAALGDIQIGNGSIGRISGSMGIYTNKLKNGTVLDAGVALYLRRCHSLAY